MEDLTENATRSHNDRANVHTRDGDCDDENTSSRRKPSTGRVVSMLEEMKENKNTPASHVAEPSPPSYYSVTALSKLISTPQEQHSAQSQPETSRFTRGG